MFDSFCQALEHFPQAFGDVRLEDFMHAFALGMFQLDLASLSIITYN